MIKGIHHVAITAKDPPRLSNYLRQVFGLDRTDKPNSAYRTETSTSPLSHFGDGAGGVLLRGANAYISIMPSSFQSDAQATKISALNSIGLRHVCFQNQTIEPLAHEITKQGGSLFSDPVDLGTGNQYAYARDVEGNIYEIEGLPYAPVQEQPWIGHVAIVVTDLDLAIEFYKALLGSEVRNRLRVGPSAMSDKMSAFKDAVLEGAWLYAGNMLIELWQFIHPNSPIEQNPDGCMKPGLHHIAFETANVASTAELVLKQGGKILRDLVQFGGVKSVFALGPDGQLFEFIEFLDSKAALSIAELPDPKICSRIDGWDNS